MAARWEVERAVLDSDLPAPARHLMHALCVLSDAKTAVIPPRFSPSLSTLARMTGLSRSAIKNHLNRLERDGWLTRTRPAVADARAKWERTRYAMRDPGLGHHVAMPGPSDDLGLGHEMDRARPSGGHRPDRKEPDRFPDPRAGARGRDEQITETVVRVLRECGKPVDRPWAEQVAKGLTEQYPRKPVTYYEAIIRRNPTPYLPTPTPPPFRARSTS